MLVEYIKCLQNSNRGTGAKQRGEESEWKNSVLLPGFWYIPQCSGMTSSWSERRLTAVGQGCLAWRSGFWTLTQPILSAWNGAA